MQTVFKNNYFLSFFASAEDCDAFEDHSTQCGTTSESLRVDPPGSSHMSNHSGELRILSVYGKGEGPLAVDGHDAIFTAFKVEALNSMSADHSVAKRVERGERLVCREERSVQVGNHLLIHHPESCYNSRGTVTTPAHTHRKRTPLSFNVSLVGIDYYSVQMKECLLCVSFFMWKAADRRHHFNQG